MLKQKLKIEKIFFKKLIIYKLIYLLQNKFFYYLNYKKLFFIKNNFYLKYYLKYLINQQVLSFKFFKTNFIWFKFNLFFGLGYKKKINKKNNFLFIYVGDRHWLLYKIPKNFFFYTFHRRNFIFFCNSKKLLFYFNNIIKDLKFMSIFKLKGFVDSRSMRKWLFVRRLKVTGVKLKLSKKQKLI